MPDKQCVSCDRLLDVSEFAQRRSSSDGLQRRCRACVQEYDRQRYLDKRERIYQRNRCYLLSVRQKLLEYKKTIACVDCGISDHRVIDFDHVGDDKRANVSDLVQNCGWDTVLAEIQKCDPVCANCHRIRTYERRENLVPR